MNTTNPNTFEIVFCIAEDTYMYLPIYLAREKGIFESVITHTPGYENYEITISFNEPKSSDEATIGGDREAVELMLSESEKGHPNKLCIAIADPVTIFKSYKNTNSRNDIKVIGQLINKFPFWVVGKYDDKFQEYSHNKLGVLKDVAGKKIYHPFPRYITANACASYVVEENQMDDMNMEPVKFDEVIERCIQDDAIGLTGDLSKMAERSVTKDISIRCHLANAIRSDGELKHIATVLITDSSSCQKYKKSVLPAVLEAIQNAIFIVYSSPNISLDVCQYVSMKYFGESKNVAKTQQIIKILNEDELYPMSLDIKAEDWINTIEFYLRQNLRPFDSKEFPKAPNRIGEDREFLIDLYKIMYEETPAKMVERTMIEKFGVSCETFDKEISYYLKRKKKENIKYILHNYGKDIITALLLGLICLIVILYILYVLIFQDIDLMNHASFWVGIIGIIISIYSINKGRRIFRIFKIR